jgi:O-methyltransferase/methyltransferase family protein
MSDLPPEARVWNLIRGSITARATALAAELGVADALADGPRPVAEVAREVGADPDALHRILRALASDGLFAEGDPGVFANTDASELLRRDNGWSDFAHLFGGLFYRALGELDASGRAAFERSFGAEFWAWLAAHPEERASFDRAMAQGKERRAQRLAEIEWSGDETVVDVGGGNGSFLVELFGRKPGPRGIVFDLPETVRDEAALRGHGIEFVEGSFFERVPPGDVYILGTILHDWDDEPAAAILRTIAANARPGARVLIVDAVLAPGNEPHGAKWLDLLMLTISGRERTEQEWRALVEGAGLRIDTIQDGLIQASCP